MNYRDRFEKTVNHVKTDRVPIDFCGTTLTSCHPVVIKKLKDYFSILAADDNEAIELIQKKLDCDFRRIGYLIEPESIYADHSNISAGIYTDSWGITRKFDGLYWDIIKNPFRDLPFSEIKTFKWPQASAIHKKTIVGIKEKAKKLYYDTDYVVVCEHPVYGFLEIGCWIFGYDDFLYRILAEPETVEWFFSNFYTYVKDINELYYGSIGEFIHVTTSGDDFGTQNGPFISPDMFGNHIKPWYRRRIDDVKQYTKAKYFHHSCGSVYKLLGDIIDMGVDILNPIQPGALEMEPERLKNKYGDKISFWGGIDEQKLLSEGSPAEIYKEVKRVITILGEKGGYILSPSHNIQPDVPVENIAAMYSAAID